MRIEPITTPFKCHMSTNESLRDYGKVIKDSGVINGFKLDIYSAYTREGKVIHKLYYLSDAVGNWVKSKLVYFQDGKKYKTIRSERR